MEEAECGEPSVRSRDFLFEHFGITSSEEFEHGTCGDSSGAAIGIPWYSDTLCQQFVIDHGPFIKDLSIKDCDFPLCFVNVYYSYGEIPVTSTNKSPRL